MTEIWQLPATELARLVRTRKGFRLGGGAGRA